MPPLPALGRIETVDQNDVGDPFIVAVPPGHLPPSGVPYLDVPGPNGYASAPWTSALVGEAVSHGWYMLVGTTDWVSNVPTAVSLNLTDWSQAPDSLPRLPVWAVDSATMTWGPAVQRADGHWVLYYSTEDARSDLECIGRAVASSPAGPFVDSSSSPLVCQTQLGGSIDPSVVRDGPAKYLVWKDNGNSDHRPVAIWVQRLAPDGLTLVGRPARLLGVDQPWEHGVVEAPAMVPAHGGGFWLFFSGGAWNSPGYATGLAYCRTITGPCTNASEKPFLSTNKAVIGPGGLDTFTDLRGRLWAAFTALVPMRSPWNPDHVFYNRVLDIAPIISH
jgi:beta-xylosidase